MDGQERRNPDQPHDILAAEAFALGAGDPQLHHEPAHDVLAAEEFPVPAPQPRPVPPEWAASTSGVPADAGGPTTVRRFAPLAALLLGLVLAARLRRRRRARAAAQQQQQ